MVFFLFFYTLVYVTIGIPLFCITALWNKKNRDGLVGRFSQVSRLRAFVTANSEKDIIFFHSASVGEWEQSIPIIQQLKQSYPDIAIIASFFSPSGMRHAKTTDVDCAIFLPFDIYFVASRFFARVKPKVWVISKYDVWPAFLYAAFRHNVPVLLCSAELAADSTRHKSFMATINRVFYSYIHTIFPVSEDYKQRFLKIFPHPDRLFVVGDARYDQIIQKAERISLQKHIEIFTTPRPITFIAGSIWPADEKHLLPVLIKLYHEHPEVQFILVPHELHESHLQAIQKEMLGAGISTERYSMFSKTESKTTSCNVAIIDTIGMLASLYVMSDVAYVGGAFSTGVHNVAEPAILKNPVVFGPKHVNSYEALQLRQIHAAFSVSDENECYDVLSKLLSDANYRSSCGEKAQQFILSNKGASQKIVSKIKTFL